MLHNLIDLRLCFLLESFTVTDLINATFFYVLYVNLSSFFPPKPHLLPPFLPPSLYMCHFTALYSAGSSSLSSSLLVFISPRPFCWFLTPRGNVGKFIFSQAGFSRFHQWMEFIPQQAQWLLKKWVSVYWTLEKFFYLTTDWKLQITNKISYLNGYNDK